MWRISACTVKARRCGCPSHGRFARRRPDAARRRTSRRVSQAWSSRARASAAWYARRLPRSGGRFDARVRRERLCIERSARRARTFFFRRRARLRERSSLEGARRVRARHRREHRQDGGLEEKSVSLDVVGVGRVVAQTRDPLSRRRRGDALHAEKRESAPPGSVRVRVRGRSAVSRPVPPGRRLGASGRVAGRRQRFARDARWRGRGRRRVPTLGRRGSARALS